ncbi:putative alpha-1,2-mannosidase [Neolewinella xylanilytica]|uniref:Putative alpha-1,2-mannosidase n=1 Tax=Neolewinella xylanilytica TaxID=1514080 RepID=A0A2S6I1S6_9BACT|nr:GH92 family glycosyl hydrolase [Neolewinella xylanilytica]PPK85110.1 putative alpha-1,2-mannosidase [Neolewinella xylanilytica]
MPTSPAPLIALFVLLLTLFPPPLPAQSTVWQLGEPDGSAREFALAPDDYPRFLAEDFGWEDRYFMIGRDTIARSFPYVLPGTVDYWGGTSSLAGIRPHALNLLFNLAGTPLPGPWELKLGVLDASPDDPPQVRITVNDRVEKFQLAPGLSDDALTGAGGRSRLQTQTVSLNPGDLRAGGNVVEITSLTGSWLVFDYVALSGPEGAELAESGPLFLYGAQAVDYEIERAGTRYQPLLVDVQHLHGAPTLRVRVDDQDRLTQRVEHGRHQFEVPVPAVTSARSSRYTILVNDSVIARGTMERSPRPVITPAGYVDTRIGTGHSRWMIAPGPWMPFGMVKISPDNQHSGWQAGYQPTFENVGTFSHVHEWTMAGLGMLPTNGPLQTQIGDPTDPDSGYRSRIDKATEQAPLGYYSVELTDYDIRAELTATTRASFQRYTYPAGDTQSRVLVDLKIPAEYEYRIEEVRLEKMGTSQLVGYSRQVTPGVWGERHYRREMVEDGDAERAWDDIEQAYTLHFAIEFDRPIRNFSVWSNGAAPGAGDTTLLTDRDSLTIEHPEDLVAIVEFATTDDPVVQVRTGVSYVSVANAEENLHREISQPYGWDFAAVRRQQEDTWNDLLGRVDITTADRREKVRFYSNMYRAIVSRNIFSDVDGSWVDATETVRKLEDSTAVALGCDAFWNTFWNLNPFWNLVVPEWSSKWVRSQLAMYDANGWLAKGPAGMEYIPVMVAEHEIPLIVGAYQMGIRDFDAEKAFSAVHKMQTTPGDTVGHGFAGNRDLETYLQHHYVPYNKGRFSNTLEYAFDDYAVAQFAGALGKRDAYAEFMDRAYWWRNAIDTTVGFARLRNSAGEWYPDFDPLQTGGNHQYAEGNAWQLTFFVPQDVPALVDLIGRDRFLRRLDDGFRASSPWRYNAPNERYWDFPVIQGNQQSMHFSYLFNWAGRPWLTQRWNRDILDRYYGFGTSNAYLGDEDQGQMSAWFVLSALGLFQTDGGTSMEPIYEIGSPLYERTVVDLGRRYGRGTTFTIIAENTSFRNKYVQSATLNGRSLQTFWFPAGELLKGGELHLQMGPEPNTEWGTGPLPQRTEHPRR